MRNESKIKKCIYIYFLVNKYKYNALNEFCDKLPAYNSSYQSIHSRGKFQSEFCNIDYIKSISI